MGISASTGFFGPAVITFIPSFVSLQRVARANAFFFTSEQIAQIIGQGVGGILLAWLGPLVLFVMNSLSFLISALFELRIPRDARPRPNKRNVPSKYKLLAHLRVGVSALCRDDTLIKSTLYVSVSNLLFISVFVLAPFLAENRSSTPSVEYGLYVACLSAGMLTGSALVFLINATNVTINYFALMAVIGACGYGMIGNYKVLAVNLFAYAAVGFSKSLESIFYNVMVTERISDRRRGRVFGVATFLSTISSPPTFLLTGLAVDHILRHVEYGFSVLAIVLLATGTAVYFWPTASRAEQRGLD